jgi:hypothetical protein
MAKDRQRQPPRNFQHSSVEIETGDAAAGCDTPRRETRDDTGPGGDIKHALAGSQLGYIKERGRPRSDHERHGPSLVAFRSIAFYLELGQPPRLTI